MEANTRYPHKVKVIREVEDRTSYPFTFSEVVVLESICRVFPSRSGGTAMQSGVVTSDYTVSMPFHEVSIMSGDVVEVTDRVRTFRGIAVSSYNGNLGANLWFNEVKN